HHIPVVCSQYSARSERADGHRTKYDEVVKRLHARLFFRSMAFKYQGRRADEAEVPSYAKQYQCEPEVSNVQTHEANCRRYADKGQAKRDNAPGSNAGDEPAGEEAGRIHGNYMPLKSKVGAFLRVAAHPHRQRSS